MAGHPDDAPPQPKRFVLSAPELQICHTIGLMRYLSCRGGHVKPRNYGKQDIISIDTDGMVGEYAFARMMNLCPDFTISERSGGHDLLTNQGRTVDVKTTRYPHGQLLGEIKKASAYSDVYVLMLVDDSSATFLGWAYGQELFDPANLTDLGHGPTYVLPQAKLRTDLRRSSLQCLASQGVLR